MSFSKCMDIVNSMDQDDQDSVLSKLDQYTSMGMSPEQAQKAAVTDVLEELKAEHAEFIRLVEEQHPEPKVESDSTIGKKDSNDAFTEADSAQHSIRDLGFYSELATQISNVSMKQAPASEWKSFIKALSAKGVKADEIEWSGVNEFLDLQTGKVTKNALIDYLNSEGVQVEETVLGDTPNVMEYDVYKRNGNRRVLMETFRTEEEALDYMDEAEADDGGRYEVVENANPEKYTTEGDTKYDQYKLDGGENYREALLALPVVDINIAEEIEQMTRRLDAMRELQDEDLSGKTKFKEKGDALEAQINELKKIPKQKASGNYTSQHWDQKNVIAHLRVDDRTDADGESVLFVHELQSDSGQAKRDGKTDWDAPFIGSTSGWLNLALKRVITMAVEGGYKKVAFINGEQSADRYSLDKKLSKVSYRKSGDDNFKVQAFDMRGLKLAIPPTLDAENLEEYIGKEIAKKIVDTATVDEQSLEGDGLKIEAKGMREFYDKLVPNALKGLLKKLGGGQLTTVEMSYDPNDALDQWESEDGQGDGSKAPVQKFEQLGFEITPQIIKRVEAGVPLFSKREQKPSIKDRIEKIRQASKGRVPVDDEVLSGTKDQNETDEFKKWFGKDSTMVNEDGSPMVLYHGTTAKNEKALGIFKRSKTGAMGPAIYLGDSPEAAAGYDDGAMMTVYARGKYLTNNQWTKYVNENEWSGAEKAARADGYSGVYDTRFENAIAVWNPQDIKSATKNNGKFSQDDPDIRHSTRQIETLEFKKWYGDWQGDQYATLGRDSDVNPIQRNGDVGADNPRSVTVGKITFPGSTGPVGKDGKPVVFYHGTREDIAVFQTDHPTRLDKGWMGRGTYVSSNSDLADMYAEFVKKGSLGPNTMPVFANVRKPYITSNSLKTKLSKASQPEIDDFTKRLRDAGFDGVAMEISDGDIELMALEPTQLKSAIGNNGNFDGADPDIRNSIRNGTSAWDAPVNTGFDDLVYKMQDRLIDTKRVIKAITDSVGQITEDFNVYLQEELFHGRAAKRVSDFEADELKPLMEHMAREGYEMADVEKYLQARHAKEANALIASRDITMPDGGSGMFDVEVDDYFNNLSAADATKLADIALKVDAITAKTRQMYADYGLESQDTVDSWGQMFQHYVPLFREDKKPNGQGTGHGFSIKSKEVKSRTGSTQKVVDILAHIAMQRERLIVRGEKNRVSTALVGLAQSNPNPDFWKVGPPPGERVYDPKTKRVIRRTDPMYKSRDNVLVAKIKQANGEIKEVAVNFNERDDRAVRMAAALKNLDAGKLEGLLGVSAKITRYFSSINTAYNPVFGVVNLVRDMQTALINLSDTPLAGKRGRIAKDAVLAIAGIYSDLRAVRQGRHPNSAWASLFEEFQNEGGQTGYRQMFATSKDRADGLQKVLTPYGWMDSKWGNYFTANGMLKVPFEKLQDGASLIFNWLSDYNESMENAVRLATYKAGVDQGMSKQTAASLAKNLTVNFNRKGEKALQAGALYAFFNAAMQGSARIGETLFEMDQGNIKTARLSKVGKKIVYGGMLLGSMQALALAAAGFGDDDPPEFVRERSLIIPTGGKTYVNIPMPLGFHVIPGLGRHLTEFAINGFEKPAQRTVSIIGMFADAFNPIGNAGLSIQTLAPTALDPLVAIRENKDWSGRPIARVSSNKALPGHKQFKDSATWIEKGIAEAINGITGGNDYVAGALSPTPDQIGYLLGQVTGGVGRELNKVAQTVGNTATGEELPLYKIPLVGRFVGNAASQASQANAFYSNVNKLNELETEIKGMRKDGKGQDAMVIVREHPEAKFINMANVTERQIQKLRKQKRELIENDAPKERIVKIEEQITQAMTRFNKAMDSVQKK